MQFEVNVLVYNILYCEMKHFFSCLLDIKLKTLTREDTILTNFIKKYVPINDIIHRYSWKKVSISNGVVGGK